MKFRYYIYQYVFINFLILFSYCFYLYFFNYSDAVIDISRERYAIINGILDMLFYLFFPLAIVSILVPIFFAKIICYGSKVNKITRSITILLIIFLLTLFSWIVGIKDKYDEIKDLDIDYMARNLQVKQVKFYRQESPSKAGARGYIYATSYVIDLENNDKLSIQCTIWKIDSCEDVQSGRFDGQIHIIKYHEWAVTKQRYLFEIVEVKDRTTDYYVLKYKTVIDKRKSFTLFAVLFYLNSLIMVINFLRKG